METNTRSSTSVTSRWTRVLGAMLTVVLMVSAEAVSQSQPIRSQSPPPVNLGTAGDFTILSKSGISTTVGTQISCDIGVSPISATAITGFGLVLDVSGRFATSSLVSGRVYAANYAAPTPAKMTTAVNDMEAAYTNAAGRTPPDHIGLGDGDITGLTLVPGVYKWTTGVLVSAAGVTLAGGLNDVWIFQISQGLTVASGAVVTLSGSAQACNVFWQVAGQVTIGTTALMKGNILCQTAIVMRTGARLDGRALAQTAVTLDANIVTSCCRIRNDRCGPLCEVTAIIPGPPKKIIITVQGPLCGLASIVVQTLTNATVDIPPFTVGQTSPVVITATKIDQSLGSTVLLRVTDVEGNVTTCDPVYATISAGMPEEFALGANYPNPFNPDTKINFNIPKAVGLVSLKVSDLMGREVKTLINEPMQAGQYRVEWDGTNNQGIAVTSGVYIYRLVAGEFVATRRMTLMK